jgi:uncharacterized membrane protein
MSSTRKIVTRRNRAHSRTVLAPTSRKRCTIGTWEQDKGVQASTAPTVRPPQPGSLNTALERNIEALQRRRKREAASASLEERIAERITRFTGSMRFVYLHLALYGIWILANLDWLGLKPWDPTFVVLAMIASVEAIFLSTFVLISQNRMQAAADKRADLDLQINLLSEHEVTKLVAMVAEISHHLGVGHVAGNDVEELKRNVAPEAVLDAIESNERAVEAAPEASDR